MTTHSVATTDGVALAAYETGDPVNPTIVAVHGYPDDHQVWDGLVAALADRFHVVTYDVRGAGASEAPTSRKGYRIAQLVADLGAVLDTVVPGRPVHLVGHDWGSIQLWDALGDVPLASRITSYTSVSGPSLDMAAAWLRQAGHPRASLKQLAASSYIAAFRTPALPELAVRRGLLERLVSHSQHVGTHARPQARGVRTRDGINGLELYRANFVGRMARPRIASIEVPVQVLAPRDDAHVTVELQLGAPQPYVATLTTHVIPGNHWVVEQDPERIARHLTDFIDSL